MDNKKNIQTPNVSIIIPVKNEEKYLDKFLKSLDIQDYPKSKSEIIFVDGNSNDNTKNIIEKYINNRDRKVSYIVNDKENAPSGVNIGIKNSSGDILLRMDVHTEYPINYISKCVLTLLETEADNVGCPVETIGKDLIGSSIAYICSSKFGVGNSSFRINGDSGYVDTVPFGCFKKELINKIGFFDENLPRSEDNDFNSRIRKSRGKVYMFTDIHTKYYSRQTLNELFKMGYCNGVGIIQLWRKDSSAIGLRHVIPLFFLLGNIIGILLLVLNLRGLGTIYLIVVSMYLVVDLYFSIKSITKTRRILSVMICILSYPIFHISYGLGSLISFLKFK